MADNTSPATTKPPRRSFTDGSYSRIPQRVDRIHRSNTNPHPPTHGRTGGTVTGRAAEVAVGGSAYGNRETPIPGGSPTSTRSLSSASPRQSQRSYSSSSTNTSLNGKKQTASLNSQSSLNRGDRGTAQLPTPTGSPRCSDDESVHSSPRVSSTKHHTSFSSSASLSDKFPVHESPSSTTTPSLSRTPSHSTSPPPSPISPSSPPTSYKNFPYPKPALPPRHSQSNTHKSTSSTSSTSPHTDEYKGRLWSDWHWNRHPSPSTVPSQNLPKSEADMEKLRQQRRDTALAQKTGGVAPPPPPYQGKGLMGKLEEAYKHLGEKMEEFSAKVYESTHYGGKDGRGRRHRESNVGF